MNASSANPVEKQIAINPSQWHLPVSNANASTFGNEETSPPEMNGRLQPVRCTAALTPWRAVYSIVAARNGRRHPLKRSHVERFG
jgi:hypothetical protein